MTAPREATTVEVRPATLGDARRLLAWANDPVTRAASFHTESITWPEHRRWLADRLASPACRLLIGYAGGVPVGQVRFDRDADGVVEISIGLDPGARGRGLATGLLRAGLAAARADASFGPRSFVARVRADNDASIRLFRRAGFHARGQAICDGVPCETFELEA